MCGVVAAYRLRIFMFKGTIYLWSSPSGKQYVGKDGVGMRYYSFTCQCRSYSSLLRAGETIFSKGVRLSRVDKARVKYPVDLWHCQILEIVRSASMEELDARLYERERFWVAYYDSYKKGYNSTKGGKGADGLYIPPSARRIMSDKAKKRKPYERTEEHKKLMSERLIGHTAKPIVSVSLDGKVVSHYDSTSEAIRLGACSRSGFMACRKGLQHVHRGCLWLFKTEYDSMSADELQAFCVKVRDRMAESKIMSSQVIAARNRVQKHCRPVVQLSKSGEFIKDWGSAKEAGASLGISHGAITGCCRDKHYTCGGFVWRYADKFYSNI